MAVIALDLGGTKLAGAVLGRNGKVVARSVAPLAGRSGKEVGCLIIDEIGKLAAAAAARRLSVSGVGICVPGLVHGEGRVWAPNIPGWKRYPLGQQIRRYCRRIGLSAIPLAVENDRACHILGESWLGAARGCSDAVFLAVGTGIGAGIKVNGTVLNGSFGTAGAIGWMALDRPYQEEYCGIGCFEYHASGGGIARVARTRGDARRSITTAEVFESFKRGEKLGKEVVCNAVECWGMALANVVSLLNPEMVIFGGGVFGPAAKLLAKIRREAEKWAQPLAMEKVRLCVSQLGADAGLLGAGYAALSSDAATAKGMSWKGSRLQACD